VAARGGDRHVLRLLALRKSLRSLSALLGEMLDPFVKVGSALRKKKAVAHPELTESDLNLLSSLSQSRLDSPFLSAEAVPLTAKALKRIEAVLQFSALPNPPPPL
jgi:hypothetical protein